MVDLPDEWTPDEYALVILSIMQAVGRPMHKDNILREAARAVMEYGPSDARAAIKSGRFVPVVDPGVLAQ